MELSLTNFTICNQKMGEKQKFICTPSKNISNSQLLNNLKIIFDLENTENFKNIIFLNLKNLNLQLLSTSIKYALSREDLNDPLMILNIINLIKIYNTLDDSFFNCQNIYVSSIEELLDLKLEIHEELNKFIKQLSLYFISLFKSYNKLTFTPLDKHIELPNIYKNIFLSCDFLTLSGIFSISDNFEIKDCIYINDAYNYLNTLLIKHHLSSKLLQMFLKEAK